MIKTTVGEFREFCKHDLGPAFKDCWFEEIGFYRTGSEDPLEDDDAVFSDEAPGALPPEEPLRMQGGTIVFPLETRKENLLLEPIFRKWLKEKATVNVLVSVPKDRLDEFNDMLSSFNAKPLKL